jgi:murein DD-endopeptidase MepM/ murein hydrolase activator NlpD
VRSISAVLKQDDILFELDPKIYDSKKWWKGSGVKEETASWTIKPLELGMNQGNTLLRVSARDSSWRNCFQGNEQVLEKVIHIDMTPPQITLKSTVHNISTGGTGMVSYKVNEAISKTGVWVDERFFPGYLMPDKKEGIYAAMIAIPFDAKEPKKLFVEAVDKAGNAAKAGFPYRIFHKSLKVDNINITDQFLNQKMPEFVTRYPQLKGSPLEVFLKINTELRHLNNQEIVNYCKESAPEILWKGSFTCLPNSACRANFGDERHYFYQDKEISKSYHMGLDLASISHSPVPAGNSGIVKFADYLGIYGNTVIIDHGLGLLSMYSHLSEIHVLVGSKVKRGDVIGLTGMTGLAGGDHLHFGMMVQGVFVNPIEWLDPKWIQDHILANLSG